MDNSVENPIKSKLLKLLDGAAIKTSHDLSTITSKITGKSIPRTTQEHRKRGYIVMGTLAAMTKLIVSYAAINYYYQTHNPVEITSNYEVRDNN